MKRLMPVSRFLVASSLALFAMGCGDDGGPDRDDLVISFKANGTQTDLANQSSLRANFTSTFGGYEGRFVGNGTGGSIRVLVYDNKMILPGTWSGYQQFGTSILGAWFEYTDPNGVVYTSSMTE